MIYLDTSAAVAFFVGDAHSDDVTWRLTVPGTVLAVSDLCHAEFVAAIGMHVRMNRYGAETGHRLIENFDAWTVVTTNFYRVGSIAIVEATRFLRRFELKLRTPGAIHLGICHRLGAQLLSYDVDQVAAARTLGIALPD